MTHYLLAPVAAITFQYAERLRTQDLGLYWTTAARVRGEVADDGQAQVLQQSRKLMIMSFFSTR